MDQSKLIHGCIQGEKESWDRFVDQFTRLIYDSIIRTFRYLGFNFSQEVLDDLHNDVFVLLLQDGCKALKIFEGRNGCSLGHYLRTIAVRKTIDYVRTRQPMLSIDDEGQETVWADQFKEATTFFTQREIEDEENVDVSVLLLNELDTEEKRLCTMFFHDRQKPELIAKSLGITVDHFYVRKQRILKKLRKIAETKKIFLYGK